jgi:hypothetical protein
LGDPLERDPESVAKDVRWNLVSREAAEEEYGVVLNDGVKWTLRRPRSGAMGSERSVQRSYPSSTMVCCLRSKSSARRSPRHGAGLTSGSRYRKSSADPEL